MLIQMLNLYSILQISFGKKVRVTKVAVQGGYQKSGESARLVTKYKIMYTQDMVTWIFYRNTITSPSKVGHSRHLCIYSCVVFMPVWHLCLCSLTMRLGGRI